MLEELIEIGTLNCMGEIGRIRLGLIAAAGCIGACVAAPPPQVGPPAPETQSIVVAPASDSAQPRQTRSARVASMSSGSTQTVSIDHPPTCINGNIRTAGQLEIPVARARVSIARGEMRMGEALTDDDGRFSWCTPKSFDGSSLRTSLRVEKSAFAASQREVDVPLGTTSEVTIGLHPVE